MSVQYTVHRVRVLAAISEAVHMNSFALCPFLQPCWRRAIFLSSLRVCDDRVVVHKHGQTLVEVLGDKELSAEDATMNKKQVCSHGR